MIGPHLYTLHPTYTGPHCAMCGQRPDDDRHDRIHMLVDGVKIVIATGERADHGTQPLQDVRAR